MTTKFNIGDEAWYLDSQRKAVQGTIYKFEHTVEQGKPDKKMYFARSGSDIQCLYEKDMFTTKEDLNAYIFG